MPTYLEALVTEPELWPHRPVFVQTGQNTCSTRGQDALPLGIPFEFETPLFKGKLLLRLRDAPTDDLGSHKAYFTGRRRAMQTVVQGQFKKPLNMADVSVGCYFERELVMKPPPFFMKIMKLTFDRLVPGLVFDLLSSKPKVSTLLAGTTQTLSVDVPGEEPDITAAEIPENAAHAFANASFKTSAKRKKKLSAPRIASKYAFDTEKVYTFHNYDQSMNYGTYTLKLPMYGEFSLSEAIGPQPMTLTAKTASGEIIYDFQVWHESVYRLKEDL